MSKKRSRKKRILEELRQSEESIRKFCKRNGLSSSTVRKWRDRYWNNQGGFVKLEKSEGPTGLLRAENGECKEKRKFGNARNVFNGQNLVVIEYKGVKVTANLEQSLKILEK